MWDFFKYLWMDLKLILPILEYAIFSFILVLIIIANPESTYIIIILAILFLALLDVLKKVIKKVILAIKNYIRHTKNSKYIILLLIVVIIFLSSILGFKFIRTRRNNIIDTNEQVVDYDTYIQNTFNSNYNKNTQIVEKDNSDDYTITSDDLQLYKQNSDYIPGKANPFGN